MSEITENIMDVVGSEEVVDTATEVIENVVDKIDTVSIDVGPKEIIGGLLIAAGGTAIVEIAKEPVKKGVHWVATKLHVDKDSRELRKQDRELKKEERRLKAEKAKIDKELKKEDNKSEKKDK